MDEVTDSFNKFWNSIGEKPNSTVRFFDRQEYYTVHFEDAEMLGRCYYRSLEVLKYFRRGNILCPYININKSNADGVFRFLLISNQYKVEVYSNNRSSNEVPWKLDFAATPGNVGKYQDILFNDTDIPCSNTLMALNIKKINDNYSIILGFCDLDNGIFVLGGFEETYTGLDQFTNLSSALFQLNCRECLIPGNDLRPELIAVRNSVQRSGLLITEVKKSYFSENNLNAISKLICKTKLNENEFLKLSDKEGIDCVNCLGAVVKYLDLTNDESLINFFDVHAFKLDNFMRIGEQCSRSLNILPYSSDLRKYDNLYGLLNSCRTNAGERLLMQWLKQPLMNVNLINNRLDIVESLVNDLTLRSSLYENHLRRIPDIQRVTKKLQRNKGNLQDIYKLYVAVRQTSEILNVLSNHEGPYKHIIKSEFISGIDEIINSTENFVQMFLSFFDFEGLKDHEFRVKSDVDENLKECDMEMTSLKSMMEKEYSKVSSKLGFESGKQVKFESSNSLGYYMRVSRKDENVLRNKNYIIIIETLKDGVKFHSPEMSTINGSYLQSRDNYEKYEKTIVDEIIKITNEYVSSMHRLSGILAKLDVLCSFAITVCSAPGVYVRPKLIHGDENVLKLNNCRHPLVEMQCNISFIPNHVSFDGEGSFQIVTGPNMGGKSTYIRSIGLICVMSQIGSFVPCEKAELSVFDRIMTRIGAGDCQLSGISTFMAEMLDISWILKTATFKSLIIIDELGRGTSTFDGFGLAWAICEHIAMELKAFCIFATHFHELTELQNKHKNVKNLHVSAQTIDNELVFLYKVEDGPSMKSYGVEVAKSCGLPECIVEDAKLKLIEYEGVRELGDTHRISELEKKRKLLMDFVRKNLDEENDFDRFVDILRENITY